MTLPTILVRFCFAVETRFKTNGPFDSLSCKAIELLLCPTTPHLLVRSSL